ncbi:MAG: chlorite dismutase family protein [Candidatus Rokubacteria bacterium]|nr:chlorite dismutase family protein [Candidatus Rokubacteria bacterium]
MEQTPPGRFMLYALFRALPAWYGLPKGEKARAIAEYLARVDDFRQRMMIRTYSTLGLKRDADFLLWLISPELELIQGLMEGLRKTPMAQYLETSGSFLAVTRESVYMRGHSEEVKVTVEPGQAKYLFVYPFVKSRDWYLLPGEERQELMNEHIRVGHQFPGIRINTAYSFGLDDQDFVVAFEGDEPREFVTLVMRLRETEGSKYTVRDTPIFTCVKKPLEEALWSLG